MTSVSVQNTTHLQGLVRHEAGQCELVETLWPSCNSDCSKTRTDTHLHEKGCVRHPAAILPLLVPRHRLRMFLQASAHATNQLYSTLQIPDAIGCYKYWFWHCTHAPLRPGGAPCHLVWDGSSPGRTPVRGFLQTCSRCSFSAAKRN